MSACRDASASVAAPTGQVTEDGRRVLLNVSTLMKGGALQVATAVIAQAASDHESSEWQFALSEPVAKELPAFGVHPEVDSRFHIFERSPSRNRDARKRLLELERAISPDLVFTLFGPAYVKFRHLHLCGVADGWVTHSNFASFTASGNMWDSAKLCARILHKAWWWKHADYWWTEVEIAKEGLVSRLHVDEDRVFVVSNTVGPQFDPTRRTAEFSSSGTAQILCLSAYYPHKNLELVPLVAKELTLICADMRFEFLLTLPEDLREAHSILECARRLGVESHVRNLGPIPVSEIPDLYATSNLAFLPTLLEGFSAVYAESMCTGLPLVTTDFRFARDVCADGAVYFKPKDASSAARQIARLLQKSDEWEAQVKRGRNIFASLPSPDEKWRLQKDLAHRLPSTHRGIGSRPANNRRG